MFADRSPPVEAVGQHFVRMSRLLRLLRMRHGYRPQQETVAASGIDLFGRQDAERMAKVDTDRHRMQNRLDFGRL
jgi:hypothetical protein